MPKCECIENCPYFKNKDASETMIDETYRKIYCLENNAGCARYLVFKTLGPGIAPVELKPHEVGKATEILKRHGKR